jgi:dynein heavy chain 1
MLATISACEGSILDDDKVVTGMEKLMKEGSQVERQIEESDEVMRQVHEALARFEPFAVVCRKLFVLLASLRELNFLYEFPAQSFMKTLEHCLETNAGTPDMEESQRIASLKRALFREVAGRIGRGLQGGDKVVMSLLLARLSTGDATLGSKPAGDTAELIRVIMEAFGSDFPWQGRSLTHLSDVTELEIGATIPLLLCSAPGYDVSGRVEAMARERKKELSAVAMGSSEGFDAAEGLVATASKRGTWVMLKNVHLCGDWLRETLVKRLQALGPQTHGDFRLFITSEISPRLPTGLLRICDKLVADAPAGLKASLGRFFSSISRDRFGIPVRNRLYLLLAWTHAVIQERLRFVPTGWSEPYEWTEADATHALDVIDSLLEASSASGGGGGGGGGRQQLDPEKLPWDAIRSTLCRGVFGGRITSDRDQSVLDGLVNRLFVPASFDVDFRLVAGGDGPVLPDGVGSRDRCLEWIDGLPMQSPPTWIGLDASAEGEREQRLAGSIAGKVAALQAKCDEDDEDGRGGAGDAGDAKEN